MKKVNKKDIFILVALVFIILILSLVGCTNKTEVETKKETVIETEQEVLPMLAWGDRPWTKILMDEINSKQWSDKIVNHCKHTEFKICLAQALSIMAKYESGFKPETSYKESFTGSDGQNIISRGLFQISISSSNQSAYKCGTKTVEQLHDPAFNISCMVKIVHFWLSKDLVFFGGDRLGLGRYHSTGRKSSKSNAKILKYMEQF